MVKTIEKLVTGQKIKNQKIPFMVRIFTTLVLMAVVFLFAAVITFISRDAGKKQISSYQECISAKGSTVQKTYPAICSTQTGERFVQPLSSEEQKLLEAPITGVTEGEFCGGIMGKTCPEGSTCRLEGTFPDAGGKCVKN